MCIIFFYQFPPPIVIVQMFLNFKNFKNYVFFFKTINIYTVLFFDLLHEYCSVFIHRLCADQFCYFICLRYNITNNEKSYLLDESFL